MQSDSLQCQLPYLHTLEGLIVESVFANQCRPVQRWSAGFVMTESYIPAMILKLFSSVFLGRLFNLNVSLSMCKMGTIIIPVLKGLQEGRCELACLVHMIATIVGEISYFWLEALLIPKIELSLFSVAPQCRISPTERKTSQED